MFRQGRETEERAIRRVVNEYEKKKKNDYFMEDL